MMEEKSLEEFERNAQRALKAYERQKEVSSRPKPPTPQAQISARTEVTLGVSRRPTALVNYLFTHIAKTPFKGEAIAEATEAAYAAGWGKVCFVHHVEQLP